MESFFTFHSLGRSSDLSSTVWALDPIQPPKTRKIIIFFCPIAVFCSSHFLPLSLSKALSLRGLNTRRLAHICSSVDPKTTITLSGLSSWARMTFTWNFVNERFLSYILFIGIVMQSDTVVLSIVDQHLWKKFFRQSWSGKFSWRLEKKFRDEWSWIRPILGFWEARSKQVCSNLFEKMVFVSITSCIYIGIGFHVEEMIRTTARRESFVVPKLSSQQDKHRMESWGLWVRFSWRCTRFLARERFSLLLTFIFLSWNIVVMKNTKSWQVSFL